jgi:tetratricopeptide (TPR) repeat protein
MNLSTMYARFRKTIAMTLGRGVVKGVDGDLIRDAEARLSSITFIDSPDQVGDAIAACDDFVARFDSASTWQVQTLVASALLQKAAFLSKYENYEEAVQVYEQVVTHFAKAGEPSLRERVRDALDSKRDALRMLPRCRAKLIAAHDELLGHYEEAPGKGLERKIAAVTLDKAILLRLEGRWAPAIRLCDEVESRFTGIGRTDVQEQVAKAIFQKSVFLQELGKFEESDRIFEELVSRFGAASERSIQDWLEPLIASRATARQKRERAAHVDELIEKFAIEQDAAVRFQVAEAFAEKAFATDAGPRIRIVDEMLGYFSEAPESPIRLLIAQALCSKAGALGRMFKMAEQEFVFAEVIRRYAEAPEAEIRAHVAATLLWRARDPPVKAQRERAIAFLDELLRRFSQERDPEIEATVAAAMFDRAIALGDEAIRDKYSALDKLITRFGHSHKPRIRGVIARSFLARAKMLGAEGKIGRQMETYNAFLRDFSEDPAIQSRSSSPMRYWT